MKDRLAEKRSIFAASENQRNCISVSNDRLIVPKTFFTYGPLGYMEV